MRNSILFITLIAYIAILHANEFTLVSKNQNMKTVKFISSEI